MDRFALEGAALYFGSADRPGCKGRGSNSHITDNSGLSQYNQKKEKKNPWR